MIGGGGMSSVRTSFNRENPGLSGISQALFDYCSSEQAVQIPVGSAAAAVADEAFAIDPVTAAGLVLDPVIIAQVARRGLAPPFGRDPLRAFGAGDVMHRAPPHESPRHAFGRRIDDVDRLGTVEKAMGAMKLLPGRRPRRGTARRSRVVEGFGADTSTIESPFNGPPPHGLRS